MNKNAEIILQMLDKGVTLGRIWHVERLQTGYYNSRPGSQPHDTITWVLQGSYRLYWERNRQTQVKQGNAVIIPAGILRHSKWESDKKPIIIHSIRLECSLGQSGINLFSLFDTPSLLPKNVISSLNKCFDSLASISKEKKSGKIKSPSTGIHLKTIMKEKEVAIALLHAVVPFLKLRDNCLSSIPRIQNLLSYLNTLKGNTISVKEMAKMCNLSISRFYRVFKAGTGLSPQAYVRKIRLKQVTERLIESQDTLAEIAAETGFADAFHLSRHFSQAYGIPPSEFRRNPHFF